MGEAFSINNLDQYTATTNVGQDEGATATDYAFSYDANGNLISNGSRTYTYSAENQLLAASDLMTGLEANYSYGPAARRVRKDVNGVSTTFLHAGDMEIAEYDSAGNLLRRYIPGLGIDQRVALIECDTGEYAIECRPGGAGAQTRYYFADRQGNVLAVAESDGTLSQRFVYTPFGVELVGDEAGNPFRYTGRRYDPETRLFYYRARYYDADLGRFLQVDPIGYEDQWNLYAYVHNNPLNATDPTGEFANFGIAVVVGLAATAVDAGIQAYQTRNNEGGPQVDWGQAARTGVVAGATTALGPMGGAAVSALGSGTEALLDSQAAGHSVSETVVNVTTSAAIGGGVALATGGVGTNMTAGLAVRELAGEVPQGSARAMQQSIAAGTGVLAATGVSEGLDATVAAGGQLLDAAAEDVSNFVSEAYEQVQSLGEPCNEPGSCN